MTTIKQIQELEISMLRDISTVCDNNDLNYYLAGGSFLGAVRHKGFIPWDDDVDINLTIKDIKRLKKCCKKQLPSYYFWQDVWDTSVEYTELFYKYFKNHENDEQVYWWYETPELLKQLESMK